MSTAIFRMPSAVRELTTDVYIINASGNHVLQYNASSSKWTNSPDITIRNLTVTGELNGIYGSFAYTDVSNTFLNGQSIIADGVDGTQSFLNITLSPGQSVSPIKVLANNGVTNLFSVGLTGTITAVTYSGSGASLTNLNASNISAGTLANARTTASSASSASAIVTRDSNSSFVANGIVASNFYGVGSGITGISATNVSVGILPSGVIPFPTTTGLGGVYAGTAASSQWVRYISTGGVGVQSQPTTSDISGLGTVATLASDTDGTFTANSDSRVATQKAVKTYVDTSVTGLLDFKGSTDCSSTPNYPSASKGDAYVVSVAGKIGGSSGTSVDVGDVYVASADNAGGTQASVGTSWFVLEHNLVGALLTANNLSDLTSASSARTNLGLGTLATQNGTFSGTSSGTNTGDQTSIVGITGTKAQFNTACSDGDFLYVGDVTTFSDEAAQDAIGAMVDSSLVYVDGTPLLTRAALTGDVTASQGSNATTIANDAVTYAKMQNVSATDKVLGRSSSGSGDVEEITCTSAGRALIDDADASAQRTTLGLTSAATTTASSANTASTLALRDAGGGVNFGNVSGVFWGNGSNITGQYFNVGFVADNNGTVLSSGLKGFIREIPNTATLVSWTAFCYPSGSVTFDVKKCSYANFNTMSSITASGNPAISSNIKNTSSNLGGWTTSATRGDLVEFYINSVTTATKAGLFLQYQT